MNQPDIDELPRKRFGLSLTDTILAALLLLSCMVGIAMVYVQSQNMMHGTRLHSRAINLAYEMALQIGNEKNLKQNYESTSGASCDKKSSLITKASNIVACWQEKAQQQLSNGSSEIYLDRSVRPAQYVIVVNWSEPSTGTASFVLRVTPQS